MIIVTRDSGVLRWREEGEDVTGTYPSEELAQGRMDVLITSITHGSVHAQVGSVIKYPWRCTEPEDGLLLNALPAGSLIHVDVLPCEGHGTVPTSRVLLLTRTGEEWKLEEYDGGEVDAHSYSG